MHCLYRDARWPGSVIEQLKIIGRSRSPAHGGAHRTPSIWYPVVPRTGFRQADTTGWGERIAQHGPR